MMGEEVILFEDELEIMLASKIPVCRICHEAEFESCTSMEAPCSCSGTVKFAHRDCIQRWCDEKGNTTCEICLQTFEPGYTAPIKKTQWPNAAVSIRSSLETPELLDTAEEQLLEENDLVADRSDSFCRLMALIITVILLVKNIISVLTGETGDYPCTLLTLLIARTSGIIIPMYILIRLIATFRDSIMHPYEDPEDEESNSRNGDDEDDYDQHHLH